MITKHRNTNKEESQEEKISRNFKKMFEIALLLSILLTACTATIQVTPQPSATAEPTATPLSASDQQATATAQALAEEEARMQEIAEVVERNKNTFTIEELNAYLAKNGTGWEGGIEAVIAAYEGSNVPFKYFIIENNHEDHGIVLSEVPYQFSHERTMYERNAFPCPKMIDERKVSKMTESIYDDLWIRPEGNYGEFGQGWDDEPGKYTTIIYMKEGVSEHGEPYDEMFPAIGGFFFEDSEGRLWKDTESDMRYISLEKIANKELSDEEMLLFSDDVLNAIRKGWTMFISDTKTGELVEERSNFKEFKELMLSAVEQ